MMTTLAAEPLSYKIPTKALEGVIVIAVCIIMIGKLALNRKFYNADQKPSIVIVNGKINREELRKNNMNATFLLSVLRLKNYPRLSEVEYAFIEPNGQLSVIPRSQEDL